MLLNVSRRLLSLAAEITRPAYEKTLDIFEYNGQLKRRYPYEMVCAEPPAA